MTNRISDSPLPLLPIESAPWQGVRVKRHRHGAGDFGGAAFHDISVAVQVSPTYEAEWQEGGKWIRREMPPLSLCLVPAETPITTRWDADIEMLWMALDPALVEQVAFDLKLRRSELRRVHGDPDLIVQQIGAALLRERATRFDSGRTYGDVLSLALASHLLHRHAVTPGPELTTRPLGALALRRSREFIESHLDSDIGLSEMAASVGLSVFHFTRSFQASTGTPPHLYLVHRRVERAVSLLLNTSKPIASIAHECGFYDQSHLNRHVKRLLGVTPGQIRPPRRNGARK